MFPCRSGMEEAWTQAVAFCETITASSTTATDYPPEATADWQCGKSEELYLSACACGPACTPTPVPQPCTDSWTSGQTNGLIDGEFECGELGPWIATEIDTAAVAEVDTPGKMGDETYAFYASLQRPRETPEQGVSVRLTSPAVSVIPRVPMKVSYWTFFDNDDAGFVGLKINGLPKKTTNARDLGTGAWNLNEYVWTPEYEIDGHEMVVEFEFLFGDVPSVQGVDGIIVNWFH